MSARSAIRSTRGASATWLRAAVSRSSSSATQRNNRSVGGRSIAPASFFLCGAAPGPHVRSVPRAGPARAWKPQGGASPLLLAAPAGGFPRRQARMCALFRVQVRRGHGSRREAHLRFFWPRSRGDSPLHSSTTTPSMSASFGRACGGGGAQGRNSRGARTAMRAWEGAQGRGAWIGMPPRHLPEGRARLPRGDIFFLFCRKYGRV